VVNTQTRQTVGGPLASGPSPTDLAIDAKGERLYVAGKDSGEVAVIDTTTRQPARSPIKVGDEPRDLAPGPDGSLYVIGVKTFAVINTNVETSRPTPKDLPDESEAAAVSSDGKKVYVLGSSGTADTVRIIDAGSKAVVASLTDDLGLAVELVVSGDDQRIYLSNFFQDGILVLDTVGPKVIGKIELKT
jgi:YVTN family beta-propeller protein